ncbi:MULTISPECIES: hypothetical protein [Arthrobacter]|uniref:hypothetical protein n=1 Tax=Arthrobacter TaxID=1663 RepID=UPI001404FD70|nr:MULTISPECIES: hypothetical protein [Arthrobacter]MBT8163044.1 hypothetical protein [Arthrobacter sp. GN70]
MSESIDVLDDITAEAIGIRPFGADFHESRAAKDRGRSEIVLSYAGEKWPNDL